MPSWIGPVLRYLPVVRQSNVRAERNDKSHLARRQGGDVESADRHECLLREGDRFVTFFGWAVGGEA